MITRTIRKAGWVHIEARRLLCVRSHGKPLYYLPGGKPEGDETIEDALHREISEELGIALSLPTISAGSITARADGHDDVAVEITLFGAQPIGTPLPGREVAQMQWLSSTDASSASLATAQLLAQLKADDVID